jgi:hypothetical protein
MSEPAALESGPATPPIVRSAAAERMRLHRQRRKAALRCLTIELREGEVDVLIRRGLLEADTRNDRLAVMNALPPRCHARCMNVMRNSGTGRADP